MGTAWVTSTDRPAAASASFGDHLCHHHPKILPMSPVAMVPIWHRGPPAERCHQSVLPPCPGHDTNILLLFMICFFWEEGQGEKTHQSQATNLACPENAKVCGLIYFSAE